MNILKGFPGKVYAPNITPDPETGAGSWSDDQLARAIREGVGHDGRALFPFMPYPDFRAMCDEDLASIIVYLRSLPPVRRQLPTTDLIFPVKYLIRSVPQPLDAPVLEPDVSTPEKRGRYLVTLAGCEDCHTPQDAHGQPLPGMDFAGGLILDGPWGRVASANITPEPSGISYRPSHVYSGDPHGICRGAEAQPDHAVAHLPRDDGRGYWHDVCFYEDGQAGAAQCRQYRAADALQDLPSNAWGRKPELGVPVHSRSADSDRVVGQPETVQKLVWGRLLPRSPSAVSEAPPSEERGVETLWRGASDTALGLEGSRPGGLWDLYLDEPVLIVGEVEVAVGARWFQLLMAERMLMGRCIGEA